MINENSLKNLEAGRPKRFGIREDTKEISAKGGRASGEARRRKSALRKIAKDLMDLPLSELGMNRLLRSGFDVTQFKTEDLTAAVSIVVGLIRSASEGNAKAAEVLADLLNEDRAKLDRLNVQLAKAQFARMEAETDYLRARAERIRDGSGNDNDAVLEFIAGMVSGSGAAADPVPGLQDPED